MLAWITSLAFGVVVLCLGALIAKAGVRGLRSFLLTRRWAEVDGVVTDTFGGDAPWCCFVVGPCRWGWTVNHGGRTSLDEAAAPELDEELSVGPQLVPLALLATSVVEHSDAPH